MRTVSTLLALSLSMLSKLWGCRPRRAGPHDEILALRADNAKLRALLQSLTGAEGLASNTIDTPPSRQSLVSDRRASTTAAEARTASRSSLRSESWSESRKMSAPRTGSRRSLRKRAATRALRWR